MKKFILLGVLMMFQILSIKAQTTPIQATFDSVLAPLDKTKIPTGFLYDKTLNYIPLHKYNGVFDTVAFYKDFDQIYCN